MASTSKMNGNSFELRRRDSDLIFSTASVFQQRAIEIMDMKPNWSFYLQTQIITQDEFDFIDVYDSTDDKKQCIDNNPLQAAKTFYELLENISKESTIQYVLILINDLLTEDKTRTEIFHTYALNKKEPMCRIFLHLLNAADEFISIMSAHVITKFACYSADYISEDELKLYMDWIKDRLVMLANNEYMQPLARCLQFLLRRDEYRTPFISANGVNTLLQILSKEINFQVQYQLIFCIWIVTFNPSFVEKIQELGLDVIPILTNILKGSDKEKVTRIILAVFRNLIEKPQDTNISKQHSTEMVHLHVLLHINLLEQKKIVDEEVVEDLKFLNDELTKAKEDLCSFENYVTEVKSGLLKWGPVHKHEFWQREAARLNDNNYELLRILVQLLKSSKDPVVLSVVCFDIGEYARCYPHGKIMIEELGANDILMQKLSDENGELDVEVLLAIQKIMVHNTFLKVFVDRIIIEKLKAGETVHGDERQM